MVQPSSCGLSVLTCIGVCLIVGVVGVGVSYVAPDPYMDEVFHVVQTQHYCAGNYSAWEDGITTPPGLYWLATAYAAATRHVTAWAALAPCSAVALRTINWLLAGLAAGVGVSTLHVVQGSSANSLLVAACVLAVPTFLQTATLLYTDVGSLAFVLLCHRLAQSSPPAPLSAQPRRLSVAPADAAAAPLCAPHRTPPRQLRLVGSAVCGAIAALFRQTNVVWVAFVAVDAGISLLHCRHYAKVGEDPGRVMPLLRLALAHRWWLLKSLLPYVTVGVCFVAFVAINGRIVLGDASHHAAVPHVRQLLYWADTLVAFLWLDLVVSKDTRRWLRTPGTVTTLAASVCVLVAALPAITYVHDFLLADNRHISFMLWRHVYSRRLLAMALLPVQVSTLWLVARRLDRSMGRPRALAFAAAVVLVLVPSPLLEFRYFLVPTVFVLLYFPFTATSGPSPSAMAASVVPGTAAAAQLVAFVLAGRRWPDGSVARLLW